MTTIDTAKSAVPAAPRDESKRETESPVEVLEDDEVERDEAEDDTDDEFDGDELDEEPSEDDEDETMDQTAEPGKPV
jgi:hypothetical protein